MERKIFQVSDSDYDFWFIAPSSDDLLVKLTYYGIGEEEGLDEVTIKELSNLESDSILVQDGDNPEVSISLTELASQYRPEDTIALIASSEQ